MIGFKKTTSFLGAFAIVSLIAASASAASSLLGTGKSYTDSLHPLGWEGSQTFTKSVTGGTLAGEVDWAIFTAANFDSLFPDYTGTPGELVYAYQVFNTGGVDISKTEAPLLSLAPADNVGDFASDGMSGVLPSSMSIISADVIWNFASPEIGYSSPATTKSAGLAFSSSRAPRTDWYVIVDGGGSVNVNGVGGPGTTAIPEPSALALLAVMAASLGIAVVRNRKNK